jgi:hypothetical protein
MSPGARQEPLHGLGRQTKDAHRLGAGHALVIDQCQRRLLARRQIPERGGERGVALIDRDEFIRRGAGIGRIEILRQRLRPRAPTLVDAEIHHDAIEPGGEAGAAGNVWEWTASWYLPYGAPQREPADGAGERVARGGSFLCSPAFCEGYRASARNHATPDTALENIGFRCVVDPERMTALAGRQSASAPQAGDLP